jgi:hypothetical protein
MRHDRGRDVAHLFGCGIIVQSQQMRFVWLALLAARSLNGAWSP